MTYRVKEVTDTFVDAAGAAAVTKYYPIPANCVGIWASVSINETPVSGSMLLVNKSANGTPVDVLIDTLIAATMATGDNNSSVFSIYEPTNTLSMPVEFLAFLRRAHAANATTFLVRINFWVRER